MLAQALNNNCQVKVSSAWPKHPLEAEDRQSGAGHTARPVVSAPEHVVPSRQERLALAEAFATLSGSERGNALCSLPLGRHYRRSTSFHIFPSV